MTNERRAIMGQVSERLLPELQRLKEKYTQRLPEPIHQRFWQLPEHRFTKPVLRGYFVFIVAQYFDYYRPTQTDNNTRQHFWHTQLPFIAEMVMTIQYLENQILDRKGGIWKHGKLQRDKLEENLLAGHFLKDALYGYIVDDLNIADAEKLDVLNTVRHIFQLVDTGQQIEKQMNGAYPHFQNDYEWCSLEYILPDDPILDQTVTEFCHLFQTAGVAKDLHLYLKRYLSRIGLTNASLFYFFSKYIIQQKLGIEHQFDKELRFAVEFGVISQLVNDVADLVPAIYGKETSTKLPNDAQSDLRNGNITLPVLVFLSIASEPEKMQFHHIYSDKKKLHLSASQITLFELLKPICKTQIIPILQQRMHQAEWYLDKNNPFAALYADIGSVVHNQKYFKVIIKD